MSRLFLFLNKAGYVDCLLLFYDCFHDGNQSSAASHQQALLTEDETEGNKGTSFNKEAIQLEQVGPDVPLR